jgi:hypothetical protein
MPYRYFVLALGSMILAVAGSLYCQLGPPVVVSAAPGGDTDHSTSLSDPERVQGIDDQIARRGPFRQFSDRLYQALARKEISLHEATEKLFYYALCCYPEYLENVWSAEPGSDMKMKLARNFVRGFRMAPGTVHGEPASAIAARLERELRELPYEKDQRTITATE